MKSCYTDINQSKILAEILPIESADMRYGYIAPYEFSDRMYDGGYDNVPYPKDFMKRNPNFSENEYDGEFPCWSLAALLGLMPKLYEFENDPNDGGCQPCLCKGWDNNQWHIVYRSSIYITEWYNDPIDAAFEMICWLKKNNKL